MRRRAKIGLSLLGTVLAALAIVGWLVARGDRLSGDRVAVVVIEGVIADSRRALDELERYQDNPAVRALVLRIDSPGGAVAPSQEIHAAVLKFRRTSGKPVVASMGRVAASGGYYIAAAATRILANPGTITGSIGVIMQLPNLSGLMEKVGVRTTIIKSGEFKDLGGAVRDLTPAERKILQDMLDDVHAQFIDAVAAGRKMERERVVALADGRIFTGRQALGAGLVDELGDLRDAVARAGALAGLPGKPRIIQERRRSLWDLLASVADGTERALSYPMPSASVDYLWTVR